MKKLLTVVLIHLVLLLCINAVYAAGTDDVIARINATRNPSVSQTPTDLKPVTLPKLFGRSLDDPICGPIDLVLVQDTTGSMIYAINSVRAALPTIIATALAASGNDLRVGLITFGDATTVQVGLTTDLALVEASINEITSGGGDGIPEASDMAILDVINGSSACPDGAHWSSVFRPGALKIIVLVTDAPPAGCDDFFDPAVDPQHAHLAASLAAADGIRIAAVYVPTDSFNDPVVVPIMEDYATTTAGAYRMTDPSGDGTGAAINDIVANCAQGLLSMSATASDIICSGGIITPDPATISITVTNTGSASCAGISLNMLAGSGPGGTGVVMSTNPVVIGTLDSSASVTVHFTVDLSPVDAGGCIFFRADLTSDCPGSDNFIVPCVEVPPCSTAFDCDVPFELVDMGSLNACYPTLTNNPGHALTGIAWLGPQVTGEAVPHLVADEANRDCFGFGRDVPSLDPGTDGVAFFGAPWMPCTQVTVAVMVTGGPNYAAYVANGGQLFLSGWKNGDYPNDSDFDDELCGGLGSEWLIHDAVVTPSPVPYLFTFMDPGVFNHGIYRGIFRFRLGSHPFGRYGYGYNLAGSPGCPANLANDTDGGFDCVGEVEDYDMCDFQLSVELLSFGATAGDGSVNLTWNTASESQSDHFEIMRDGVAVAQVRGSGHSSTETRYTYTDKDLVNGTLYNYKLVAVDVNGGRQELSTASASPALGEGAVTEYALNQNYPNPFNPTTSISFDLVSSNFVTLKVYNMVGQEVATLVNGNLSQGRHTVSFDAKDLPSGLYMYRMEAGSFSATKKMLLMK